MFKWFGNLLDSNEKVINRLQPVIDKINSLEAEYEKLSAEELKAKTGEFKSRLQSGEDLEDLLPEAFAAVREAAKRTIGQRAFDVQLIGGIVLRFLIIYSGDRTPLPGEAEFLAKLPRGDEEFLRAWEGAGP